LRNDTNNGVPYLPSGPAETSQVDYSKGYSVGYTAVLRPTLVNNFRYGYTRQSFGELGNQTQDMIFFRGLNDSGVVTNNNQYQVPIQNFVDDVSWIKGRHTLQFGGNLNFLRNPQSNNFNSFSSASDNPSWYDTAAFANTGVAGHFDPACSTGPGACTGPAYPAVDSGFGNSYD